SDVVVPSGVTVKARLPWLAELKFVSPPYRATMVCVPAGKDEVWKLAAPPVSVAVPSAGPAPAKNVTVPVGVPEPSGTGDSVAVKVTDWLKELALGVAVTETLAAAWCTVTMVVVVVLDLRKLVSPL